MTTQDKLLKSNRLGRARKEQAEQGLDQVYGSRYTEYRQRYEAAGRFA